MSSFVTVELIGKVDACLCRAVLSGYNSNIKLLSELLHYADMKLLRSTLRSTHRVHQLLPPLKFILMKLRTSHCAVSLPTAITTYINTHLFYAVYLMGYTNCLG